MTVMRDTQGKWMYQQWQCWLSLRLCLATGSKRERDDNDEAVLTCFEWVNETHTEQELNSQRDTNKDTQTPDETPRTNWLRRWWGDAEREHSSNFEHRTHQHWLETPASGRRLQFFSYATEKECWEEESSRADQIRSSEEGRERRQRNRESVNAESQRRRKEDPVAMTTLSSLSSSIELGSVLKCLGG